jgi:nitrite reductase/ring-hydroxylating ferredoxin subunit
VSLSGLSALLHFVGYGSYLSPNDTVSKDTTESETENRTETKTDTAAQRKIERMRIANLSEIPPGSEIVFNWPTGFGYYGTNILLRDEAGNLHAYNSVCTHLQCLAHYDSKLGYIYCPCHGSVFNPTTGEVVVGAALRALPVIKLETDENGDIYAVGYEGIFGYGRG